VGIDNSPRQLATARRLQDEHRLHFPLLLGNAEAVPYPDATFDLAISEYGASIWADPYRWIPEAARLLRPGGELIFLVNAALWMLCVPEHNDEGPAGDRLLRPYFGMYRSEWPDDPGVEFHLPHGEWIRLLRRSGFEVTDLIEVQPPEGAQTSFPLTTLEWARRWPCEEIWKARKADR
jgi:SAM-dependent methyltransferase